MKEGEIEQLVDPRLRGAYDVIQLKRLAFAASLCIRASSTWRPTIGKVSLLIPNSTLAYINHYLIIIIRFQWTNKWHYYRNVSHNQQQQFHHQNVSHNNNPTNFCWFLNKCVIVSLSSQVKSVLIYEIFNLFVIEDD